MNEQSDGRFGWLVLVTGIGVGSCVSGMCGLVLGFGILGQLYWTVPGRGLPSSSPSIAPPMPTPTLAPMPTLSLTPYVDQYPAFTVYWKRPLWESAVSGSVLTEDFEKDEADYGELSFPYRTGNGLILAGRSTAQIIKDETLLASGNLIHFRDWGNGLTFSFPNDTAVSAFGFDYKPTEAWQLTVNDSVITIPKGRRGFVGIVLYADYPKQFVLSCGEQAQCGLTVDNISYISHSSP